MLNPKNSNTKALANYLEKVRSLLEKCYPVLLQNTPLAREFVIELDRIVMGFCKKPPQNSKELEGYIVQNMLNVDIKSAVWQEIFFFCAKVLEGASAPDKNFCGGEIVNMIYFFRNTLALLIGVSVKPPDFYEGDAAASKN